MNSRTSCVWRRLFPLTLLFATIVLDDQHSTHRWMNEVDLKTAIDVHDNTKAYFC